NTERIVSEPMVITPGLRRRVTQATRSPVQAPALRTEKGECMAPRKQWVLAALLAALLFTVVPASARRLKCPPDSVKVGNVCVDTYEESVWKIPPENKQLIRAVRAGTATLADLTSGGASQLSPSPSCSPGYPANFPASGQWTPVPGSNPPSPGIYA